MTTFLRAMVLSAFIVVSCAARADDAAPDALVKSTVDDVLTVIKQNKDKSALRQLAEKKVVPHFDFSAMTRLAVGRTWRDATPDQQQALEREFRALLVNTYTTALSLSSTAPNTTVEVKPLPANANANASDVTVKTVVTQPGKPPVPIDYRLAHAAGGWKVYDVIVDYVSLVTNYRGSFQAEVERSGIDGLIKALAEKNRAVAKG